MASTETESQPGFNTTFRTMYDNSIFESDSNDEVNEQTELGLIGAMMDGWVQEFDFRGLKVVEERDFIMVKHPIHDRQLGWKIHIPGASVNQVHEWLENKADLYEVAQ